MLHRTSWATLLIVAVGFSAARGDDSATSEKSTGTKPVAEHNGKTASSTAKKKIRLGRIILEDEYPEGVGPEGLFGELEPRLRDVTGWLDKAAKDESLTGIILEVRSPEIGLGKINELRAAISRLRKSGKKVYADLPMGMNKDYLIASACDEIMMPESGMLMLTGMRVEVTFFKNLFDKLGIQADFVQVGDFKGAADRFTRSDMSPEFRKQFEAVIDDYFQQMIAQIAADRKLKPERVRELIDEGLFTATRAKEVGLVDRICYDDELAAQLRAEHGAQSMVVENGYGKQRLDTDLSGFAGFMKLMEMIAGNPQGSKSTRGQKIALVYAVGPILPGESKAGIFGAQTLGGDTIVRALRTAEKDERVKAIVLRVDSPGGSALASDLIWREVVRAKKPVVASMGDVAGSGGYYISMGADKIVAEAGTLTGSIGVVSGKLALKGLFNKVGVTTHVISRGKNSGALSSLEPLAPSEREAWMRISKDIYRQFTQKAAKGRKLDVAKLEQLAGGRLFTGKMAAANGLVDKVGTLDDAIAEAKSLAGIKAEDKVELLILPKPKSFFEQLFENQVPEDHTWTALPEVGQNLEMLRTVRELFRQPVVTWMPFSMEVK